MSAPGPEEMSREMIGAFVHELRTPLTSIRMIIDIAKRASPGPELVLDAELREMLEETLGELQELATSLQDGSRLERGKLQPIRTTCQIEEVFGAVSDMVGPDIVLIDETEPGICGEWDHPRLVGAIAGFVKAVHRCGNGDLEVRARAWEASDSCQLHVESGAAGGESRPVNADLGYPFFQAATFIGAMGGDFSVDRRTRYCAIDVRLPMREV